MRLEIEVSDDEAAYLLEKWRRVEPDHYGFYDQRLVARLAFALPRPIHIGDRVERNYHVDDSVFDVVAIDVDMAWLRKANGAYESEGLQFLRSVAAGAASERPQQ